ncbi:MAG TPA: LysR family transcriptional regulator [Steroidobacteraceae bacterium]|nr:LysR family transcriptional regulator [Steroidobacteraceae bacterium]
MPIEMCHLTLRQLQIFAAVARLGSTAAAATAVALSQSAASSAINELERVLGLRLFDRAAKRIVLNDNGRALLPRALAVLDGALRFEEAARDASDQIQALRIGASTTIGNYLLPALLARFLADRQRRASSWRSTVAIGNTAEICRSVGAFELDIGLIEGPCPEPALAVTPWMQDQLVIVAAPSHELTGRARRARGAQAVSSKQLRSAVWLVREQGSGTRQATDMALLPHLHSYARQIEFGSTEAIKHAAAANLGLTCLSRLAVADWLDSGRIVEIATTLPRLRRQCYIVTHRAKQVTATMHGFKALALAPPAA